MNYLQLPAESFDKFVPDMKQGYGLVVSERRANVHLAEDMFGCGWVAWRQTNKFYRLSKDGEKEFVTIQNGDGSKIISVSKDQYKAWNKCKFFSEPYGWSFGRVLSCMAQITNKYGLINPFNELQKIKYFLYNLFNTGDENGEEG